MDSVAIVILNWNRMDDTRRCLDSVFRQTNKTFSVVLVDNASTERATATSLKNLQTLYQEKLVILQNGTNKGFAGGVNTGIEYARTHGFKYVALLNNDATVDENWLDKLLEAAEPKDVGIVTGLLLHADGKTIDSTGDWYSTWGLPFPRARDNSANTAPASGYVFGASGGASLYKTALFDDIGLFDEVYFAYYEDTDISFRANLRKWKIYYTNKAVAYHEQGATSSKIPGFTVYQTMKNLPLLYIKNVPTGLLIPIGIRFWLSYILFLLNAVRKGSAIPALKGWVVGCWYFLTHGIVKRWAIQRGRKLSTPELKNQLWHDLPPDQTGLRKLRAFFVRGK